MVNAGCIAVSVAHISQVAGARPGKEDSVVREMHLFNFGNYHHHNPQEICFCHILKKFVYKVCKDFFCVPSCLCAFLGKPSGRAERWRD